MSSASTVPARGLIDTNVVIDAHRQYPPAVAFLLAVQATGPAEISIVSSMEMVDGCQNGSAQSKLLLTLSQFTVHPVSATMSQDAFQLMLQFRLSHSLDIEDSLIAATARELVLPLYTVNVKHFQMIPNLTVLRPY